MVYNELLADRKRSQINRKMHTGLEVSASQSWSFEFINPIAKYLVSSDQETLVGKSLLVALNNLNTFLFSEFQRYMSESKAIARMLLFPQSMMFE